MFTLYVLIEAAECRRVSVLSVDSWGWVCIFEDCLAYLKLFLIVFVADKALAVSSIKKKIIDIASQANPEVCKRNRSNGAGNIFPFPN